MHDLHRCTFGADSGLEADAAARAAAAAGSSTAVSVSARKGEEGNGVEAVIAEGKGARAKGEAELAWERFQHGQDWFINLICACHRPDGREQLEESNWKRVQTLAPCSAGGSAALIGCSDGHPRLATSLGNLALTRAHALLLSCHGAF